MSNITRFSQWVPFEVGMAAQKDMPTATFFEGRCFFARFFAILASIKEIYGY